MPSSEPGWTAAFSDSLASCDLDAATAILDAMATAHAGTAPQAVKHTAIASIRKAYGTESGRTRDAGLVLTMSDSATAKEIRISLLPPF